VEKELEKSYGVQCQMAQLPAVEEGKEETAQ
jgi:hypothetical protein